MLSQLQKHYQQVTNKLFTPPQPHQAAAAAKLAAKNKMKSSSAPIRKQGPIVPPTKTKMATINKDENNNSTVSSSPENEKFKALVQEDENSTSNRNYTNKNTTTATKAEDIKIQRTKSKSQRIRSIQHAMSKERSVREAQEPFDFWTNVKQFNWKALIVFMICWTILGYYVIPTIKGWKGFKPPTEEEKRDEYNKGKQKLVEDTYRLRQRIEARKMRADRIEGLELSEGKSEVKQ